MALKGGPPKNNLERTSDAVFPRDVEGARGAALGIELEVAEPPAAKLDESTGSRTAFAFELKLDPTPERTGVPAPTAVSRPVASCAFMTGCMLSPVSELSANLRLLLGGGGAPSGEGILTTL